MRVLVDGSVVESFFDGGRARVTSRAYDMPDGLRWRAVMANGTAAGGVTVDVDVWEMRSAWL